MLTVGGRFVHATAKPTDEIRNHAIAYFGKRGFVEIPPLSLITGHPFNDGLRYDDSRTQYPRQNWLSLQYSARVDDIAERDRPGVLAGFTIMAIGHPMPAEPGTLLVAVLEYLLNERKLDPTRMVFVSTELFKPHLDRAAQFGATRFMQRSTAEARAAGDGSGHFAPSGHPAQPSFATVGIYYLMPGVAPPAQLSYPPKAYVEIAEAPITIGAGRQPETGNAGIGLERLAMAEGKPAPDFEESRRNLLLAIDNEAKRTGKARPPGYRKFASL
jgi:hypothetical protein